MGRITGIYVLSKQEDDSFITINEDRNLRVLLKRESGQFWPSIIQDLPNVPTALFCDEDHLRIFVGLVTGVIMEYQCQQDLNSISLKRQWTAHAGSITGLIYSGLIQQIFSCGKDRNLIWHCSDTTNKIGNNFL